MNVLTEEQQEKLSRLPSSGPVGRYQVIVDLRSHGQRKATKAHITYVRATSEQRARMVGYFSVKNLFGPLYRKKGLIVSNASAYLQGVIK